MPFRNRSSVVVGRTGAEPMVGVAAIGREDARPACPLALASPERGGPTFLLPTSCVLLSYLLLTSYFSLLTFPNGFIGSSRRPSADRATRMSRRRNRVASCFALMTNQVASLR